MRADRAERLRALKDKAAFPPAVSSAIRGETEKVVHSYPETAVDPDEFGNVIDFALGRTSLTATINQKEQRMLTEADLNRLKGLLHFLNGTEASEVKFVIDVYSKHGHTLGRIQRDTESGTYGFRPSS